MKKKYTAVEAMERIELKKACPEYVKAHARKNGVNIIDMEEKQRLALDIHACHMSGKLYGVACVSTCPTVNPNCLMAMSNPDSPCHHCFSVKTMAMYNSLREWLENNAAILSSRLLSEMEIATLVKYFRKDSKAGVVRIEAFGDAINTLQCINYLSIVNAGAAYGLYFAMWTKLPHIWNIAISEMGKPANLTCIYSAPALNQTVCPMPAMYDWLDCVFVVCDDIDGTVNELTKNGEKIHYCTCKKGACADKEICGFCYGKFARRDVCGRVTWILEKLR